MILHSFVTYPSNLPTGICYCSVLVATSKYQSNLKRMEVDQLLSGCVRLRPATHHGVLANKSLLLLLPLALRPVHVQNGTLVHSH
jgi:hypothetical protein